MIELHFLVKIKKAFNKVMATKKMAIKLISKYLKLVNTPAKRKTIVNVHKIYIIMVMKLFTKYPYICFNVKLLRTSDEARQTKFDIQ